MWNRSFQFDCLHRDLNFPGQPGILTKQCLFRLTLLRLTKKMQTSSVSLFAPHRLVHPFRFRILRLLAKAGLCPLWVASLQGHQPPWSLFLSPPLALARGLLSSASRHSEPPLLKQKHRATRKASPASASALALYPHLHLPLQEGPWVPPVCLSSSLLSTHRSLAAGWHTPSPRAPGHPATCFHHSVSEKHHPGEKLWLNSMGWSFCWDLGVSLLVCGLEYILSDASGHLSSTKPQFRAAQAKGSGC